MACEGERKGDHNGDNTRCDFLCDGCGTRKVSRRHELEIGPASEARLRRLLALPRRTLTTENLSCPACSLLGGTVYEESGGTGPSFREMVEGVTWESSFTTEILETTRSF